MNKTAFDILSIISIITAVFVQEFVGVIWLFTFLFIFSLWYSIGKKVFPISKDKLIKRWLFFSPKNTKPNNVSWDPKLRIVLRILVVLFVIGVYTAISNLPPIFSFMIIPGIALAIGVPVIIYDIFWNEFVEKIK